MALILYNIFLVVYRLGFRLVAPWNPKARLALQGRKRLFIELQATLQQNQSPLIWMHCASLGEFEQGRPVLEGLRKDLPEHKILITFFSPSGYEIRKNYAGADYVFYLPMDSASNAARFLSIVRPSLVLWVKYEYWYYFLTAIRQREIPLLLISGIFRPGQVFFRWYGGLYRSMLRCFTHLFVQTREAADLLQNIGFSQNISVTGDTRFDRVAAIAAQFQPIATVTRFCGNDPVIVAGSTWPEDEEELDHYANTHRHIKFIIAPHEISEDHLKDIERLFKYTVRYSVYTDKQYSADEQELPNVLIIDNIGMLATLYHYATIAYIGGGFGEDGVHNVLEAAVYSKPVVHGPVYEKYAEAVSLVACGGAFVADNALALENTINGLLQEKNVYDSAAVKAGKFVLQHKGATEKILNYIQANRLLTS